MCFSHHPHHCNMPVPSSFHPDLPPGLPSPSPAFSSTQMLKGCFQLLPKQRHFGATQLVPEQSFTSFLAGFSCRDGFSLPSLCWLEPSSLDCVLLEGFTCGLSSVACLALQQLFAFSSKIKETYCSSCSERHCSDRIEPLLCPCSFYFPLLPHQKLTVGGKRL